MHTVPLPLRDVLTRTYPLLLLLCVGLVGFERRHHDVIDSIQRLQHTPRRAAKGTLYDPAHQRSPAQAIRLPEKPAKPGFQPRHGQCGFCWTSPAAIREA